MSWERDVLDDTVEGLAARNGAALLALQLQTQVRRYLDTIEGHAVTVSSMRARLSDAERIGLAVMRAEQAGRKTVRVADLVGAATATTEPAPNYVAALEAKIAAAEAESLRQHDAGTCHLSEWSCSYCEDAS